MSITVRLSYGERFLNWAMNHTKLYIRGQQGKDWKRQRELDAELWEAINPWLKALVAEAVAEDRAEHLDEQAKAVVTMLLRKDAVRLHKLGDEEHGVTLTDWVKQALKGAK